VAGLAAATDGRDAFAKPGTPLRVATLGEDPGLLDLVRALVDGPVEHADEGRRVASDTSDVPNATASTRGPSPRSLRWTAAANAGPELQRLAAQSHSAPLLVDWQQLLGSDQYDLIVVASRPRGEETLAEREEQLRRLFQGAIPLVLVHPACEMILAYELEMIRKDTGIRVFPYVPLAERPELAVLRVAEQVARSDAGAGPAGGLVEQWIWERTATDRSRDAVLDDFARDALVLRELLGEIKQVTAVGAGEGSDGDEVQYGQLTVHLTAAGGQSARWSILPTRGGEAPRIRATAIGAGPSWTWEARADGAEGRLEGLDAAGLAASANAADNRLSPAHAFWNRVTTELGPQAEPSAEDGVTRPQGLDWEHVCRGLELTDGVQRSSRRRRTIDLYHEQVSEQATFKSLMAAGGCAMLFWVLAMLMVAGLVDAMQLPIRDTAWWRLFPVVIFLPLGCFLGLQLLQLVFPPSGTRTR